jgi:hypothetical protein
MQNALADDYEAIAGMVFGGIPPLSAALIRVAQFEQSANGGLAALLA